LPASTANLKNLPIITHFTADPDDKEQTLIGMEKEIEKLSLSQPSSYGSRKKGNHDCQMRY
jgi:hypothetical protein